MASTRLGILMQASKIRTWSMRRVAAVASLLVLSFVLAAMAAPLRPSVVSRASTDTTYGGRAYGVGIQLPLSGATTYADTGSLPASGGFLVADFAPVSNAAADATVFLSYASGLMGAGKSEVATMDVTLLPGTPYTVVSSFVYSTSNADCTGVGGSSQIPDLTVGGVAVPVTGAPNQVYDVPGVLELVINEQIDSSSGSVHSITVNALDLNVYGVAQVIVSSAQSAVECGTITGLSLPSLSVHASTVGDVTAQWAPTADFMTGGGYFEPPNSNRPGRVNFGFNVGPRPGTYPTLLGHVNVVDHATGDHFEGTDVTDYYAAGDPQNVCRIASGDATVNGVPGYTYMLGVCDYGEPGRADRFDFQVFLGGTMVYFASNAQTTSPCPPDQPYCGELDGGNIQLHTFSTS